MEQYFLITTQSKADTPLIDLINGKVKMDGKKRPSLWKLLSARNIEQLIVYYPVLLYRIRALLPLMMLTTRLKILGFRKSWFYLKDYLLFLVKRKKKEELNVEAKSLRKTVDKDLPAIETDLLAMIPLRKGRW